MKVQTISHQMTFEAVSTTLDFDFSYIYTDHISQDASDQQGCENGSAAETQTGRRGSHCKKFLPDLKEPTTENPVCLK